MASSNEIETVGAAAQASTDDRKPAIIESATPQISLDATQWGMVAFMTSEVAFFGALIAAYISFLGQDQNGPTPADVLSLPLAVATTFCLVSSSLTVHRADRALARARQTRFRLWWSVTIVLGILFLAGTAYEWHDLITQHQLTINRNLFGTTFYTLVGFHALHVSIGVLIMLIVLGLTLSRQVTTDHRTPVQLVAWYWHLVDSVWLVVFTVVYLVGR